VASTRKHGLKQFLRDNDVAVVLPQTKFVEDKALTRAFLSEKHLAPKELNFSHTAQDYGAKLGLGVGLYLISLRRRVYPCCGGLLPAAESVAHMSERGPCGKADSYCRQSNALFLNSPSFCAEWRWCSCC